MDRVAPMRKYPARNVDKWCGVVNGQLPEGAVSTNINGTKKYVFKTTVEGLDAVECEELEKICGTGQPQVLCNKEGVPFQWIRVDSSGDLEGDVVPVVAFRHEFRNVTIGRLPNGCMGIVDQRTFYPGGFIGGSSNEKKNFEVLCYGNGRT